LIYNSTFDFIQKRGVKLLEAAIFECLKPAKARWINVIFKFYMNPISLDCWLYENSFIWDYLYHKFAWNSYHFDCKIVTWSWEPLVYISEYFWQMTVYLKVKSIFASEYCLNNCFSVSKLNMKDNFEFYSLKHKNQYHFSII
jgi:hypothetical protein